MADIVVRQSDQVPIETQVRYRDMGDGTHALVISTQASAITPVRVLNDVNVVQRNDVEVVQPAHDDLNANVNLQIADADASASNPVPVATEQLRISLTPTISAAVIYAPGDALGNQLEFPNAVLAAGGSGMITKIEIVDNDQELTPVELWLFDQGFTVIADNASFDPTNADLLNCLGYIDIAATDYTDLADNALAVKTSGLRMPFPYQLDETNTALALWGQLRISGAATPTYTAVDDITVIITVERYS